MRRNRLQAYADLKWKLPLFRLAQSLPCHLVSQQLTAGELFSLCFSRRLKGPRILELILGPRCMALQEQQLWSTSRALPVLPGQEQHWPIGKSSLVLNVPSAAFQFILDLSCCSLLGSLEWPIRSCPGSPTFKEHQGFCTQI